jgi:serine/threonine protein kinase
MYGIAGLLTGRTLATRYRIDAVIGRGGMGAVYSATDERLGREVAVKVIGAAAADPREHARLRARFHREARAAASLRHPNVVAVHDYGTDAEVDLDFLVMELLRGEDLAARLTRMGPPPVPVTLCILRQAARGLAAGHRVGLIHRDVKPGNIFLEESDSPDEPHVYLMDFGIARLESDDGTLMQLTEFGRAPFSPAYASPEQLRGEDGVTPASDVFSLAAVGYHMATGVRPFTSAEPARAEQEMAESVRALRDRAPDLPVELYTTLVRGLSPTPAQRFADAGTFAEALGATPTVARGPAPRPAAPAPRAGAASAGGDDHTRLLTNPRPAPPRHAPLASAVSLEPDDDHTRFQTNPRPAPPRAAAADAALMTRLAPPAPPGRAAPFSVPATVAVPARQPGRTRRYVRALWDLTVTATAVGLFMAAWAAAAAGVVEDNRTLLLLGGAATILFTPLAVHRLTGRRGRYGLAVLGSGVATGAAVRLVGVDADPAITLAAVFGLQVLTCFVLAWLTRNRREVVRV